MNGCCWLNHSSSETRKFPEGVAGSMLLSSDGAFKELVGQSGDDDPTLKSVDLSPEGISNSGMTRLVDDIFRKTGAKALTDVVQDHPPIRNPISIGSGIRERCS